MRGPAISGGKKLLRVLMHLVADLIIVILLTIVLAEFVLRAWPLDVVEREVYYLNWTSVSIGFSEWNDRYSYRHPKSSRFVHKTPDYLATYTTDADGFRTTVNKATPDAPRLMLLGDSFTWGTGLNDDQTVGQRLADSAEFRVSNLGQSGYGTVSEWMLMQDYTERLRPDAIVLIVCGNDYLDNTDGYKPTASISQDGGELVITKPEKAHAIFDLLKRERDSGRGFYSLTDALTSRQIFDGYLRRYSRSYLAYTLLRKTMYEMARNILGRSDPPLSTMPRGQIMEALLASMRDFAKQHDAAFFVVRVSERKIIHKPGSRFRAHLRQTAEMLGIPFLDLNDVFAKSEDWNRYFFVHEGHWSPEGAQVAATAIHDFLNSNEKLWDKARSLKEATPE